MLLSIVIPVYNGEKTISSCIFSIINQPVNYNYEIIIINDGSTDDTLSIIADLQKRFHNIIIINQSNKGLSYSRNKGLIKAKGKWIWFVDGDDEIHPNSLNNILNALETNVNLDIINFNFKVGKHIDTNYNFKENLYGNSIKLFTKNNIYGAVWNKIYRKDFLSINRIYFITGILCEDIEFNIKAFIKANQILFSPIYIYIYKYYPNSLCHSKNRQHEIINGFIYSLTHVNTICQSHPQYLAKAAFILITYINQMLRNIDIEEREKYLQKMSTIKLTHLKFCPSIPYTVSRLFSISPKLCYELQTLRSKFTKLLRK